MTRPIDLLGFRAAQDDVLDVEQLRVLREGEDELHDAFRARHYIHDGSHAWPDEFAGAVRLYEFREPVSGDPLITEDTLLHAEPIWTAGTWSDDAGWEKDGAVVRFRASHPDGFRVREVQVDVAATATGAPFVPRYDVSTRGIVVDLDPYADAAGVVFPLTALWSVLIIAYLTRE